MSVTRPASSSATATGPTAGRRVTPRRVLTGSAITLLAVGGLVGLASTPAAAHVSPDKTEVAAGGYTDIRLGVGHGCEASPTTKLEVQVPAEILNITPYLVPGWTVTVTPETLDTPAEGSHGEQITERDAVVTWTAEPGQELIDGFKIQFGLNFQVPDAEGTTLTFPTVQTCQEGTSDWIEIAAEGEDEPEYPAPAVLIVASTGDGHGSTDEEPTDITTSDAPDTSDTGGDSGSDDDEDDDDSDSSSGLAIAGLVAGLGGLGLGGAAFARSRR